MVGVAYLDNIVNSIKSFNLPVNDWQLVRTKFSPNLVSNVSLFKFFMKIQNIL